MRAPFTLFLLACLGSGLAAPLAAQAPEPSPLNRFAACIVAKDGASSEALVRADPGSDAEGKASTALNVPRRLCGRRLAQDRGLPDLLLFRGVLAERLWEAKPGTLPEAPPSESDLRAMDFDKGLRKAGRREVDYRLARCVVASQPRLVANLLQSAPGMTSEQSANIALRETVAACLPYGASVKLDGTLLRALLTEQAYRTVTGPSA
jgi:hypothetical protein